MNGFELIKSFYSLVFDQEKDIRPTHISLYMFLLNQNNRNMWADWFKCPYDLAMQGARIGNKGTYYKCLEELKQLGLIDYRKGENAFKAPLIKLLKVYNTEPLTVPQSEPQRVLHTEPQSEPLSEQLSGNIYKLITTNIKTINFKHKEVEAFFIDLVKKDESLFEDLKPEIRYPYTSDEFLANWGAWKKYKKDQKKFKWSVESEQAALLKLSKISKTDSEAVEIIQESMANGWAGLFELKNKTNGTEQKSPAEQFADIYNSDAAKNFRFSPDNNR